SNNRGIIWKLSKRTINVTDYRNGKDEVNPAKDRTFHGVVNHLILFPREFVAYIFQPSTLESWIVSLQKNRGDILFAVQGSMHQKQFLRQELHSIYFEILQGL